jgi:hypothetical protein
VPLDRAGGRPPPLAVPSRYVQPNRPQLLRIAEPGEPHDNEATCEIREVGSALIDPAGLGPLVVESSNNSPNGRGLQRRRSRRLRRRNSVKFDPDDQVADPPDSPSADADSHTESSTRGSSIACSCERSTSRRFGNAASPAPSHYCVRMAALTPLGIGPTALGRQRASRQALLFGRRRRRQRGRGEDAPRFPERR